MKTHSTPAERRRRYMERHALLKTQRSSWDAHWRELAENFWPRGARFLTSDANRGGKVNDKIINGTPLRARRTLSAGMHSAVTPPSREWFALAIDDPQLAELETVKRFLSRTKDALLSLFARCNFYKQAPDMHDSLVTFGNSLQMLDEDDTDDMRVYSRQIGTYCLVVNAAGKIAGFFYETQMTVEQVVERFGLDVCSSPVQEAYRNCRYDDPVVVVHVVEPNRDHVAGAVGTRGKRWLSVWFESSAAEDSGFLSEKGYFEQPFIAPAWRRKDGESYGECPAMDALGDAKELQAAELDKMRMSALLTKQPTQGPPELKANLVSLLPGEYTSVPGMAAGAKVSPIMDMTALAQGKRDAVADIKELEARIEALLYVDMWLLLQSRTGERTAREVDELRDEKLLQLGPITDNLKDDALDPLIARALGILGRKGKLPEVPQELHGRTFRVLYLSPMAQAQRMQSTVGMQRLAGFVLEAGKTVPQMLDKVDWDQFIDEYSKAVGVPPSIVRPDDAVAKLRQQRQEAEAQQRQLEAAQQTADTAKTLAGAQLNGDENALNALLRTRGAA